MATMIVLGEFMVVVNLCAKYFKGVNQAPANVSYPAVVVYVAAL